MTKTLYGKNRDYITKELNYLQNRWTKFKFVIKYYDDRPYFIEWDIKEQFKTSSLKDIFVGDSVSYNIENSRNGKFLVDILLDGWGATGEGDEWLFNHPEFRDFDEEITLTRQQDYEQN